MMLMRTLMMCGLLCLHACQHIRPAEKVAAVRPNILLVVFEDMSQKVGAFGDPVATTPVLDAFAGQSVIYPNTFTTAGVCAPSRAALITGVHQQTLGAQHMRTHAFGTEYDPAGFEIGYASVPPPEVKAFPELMRQAGYYTFVGYGGWVISNKKDYQFGTPLTIWNQDDVNASWRGRKPGQPFFGMVTLATTHESFLFPEVPVRDTELAKSVGARNARLLAGKERVTDPAAVIVPPWLPDTEEVREEIATQYDNITFTEKKLAQLLSDLEREGLADSTFVIVTTDHGDGFPRAKRSIYDSGIKVPMMIRFPGGNYAGEVRDEMISFVDFAPTLLSLAGAPVPDWLQGKNFLGDNREDPNQYIFASSDRMDAWMDRVKAVRDERYKLILNYQNDVPFFQPVAFREELRSMQALNGLHMKGDLPPSLEQYFDTPRPLIELYDTFSDPDEMRNLAQDAALTDVLARLSSALDGWLAETPDLSALPEAEMVNEMWPGGQQPVTSLPVLRLLRDKDGAARLDISSGTRGASLAWRPLGAQDAEWQVYVSGQTVPAQSCVEAIAIRYGYKASDIVEACVNAEEWRERQ
ncbi:hypothetical protein HY29_01050 [Hyphomonas beringensis]|uniref:Sulfatase N-terminal domain-containing protein n=1 Tax=Hyphomonas beringensis TaxID=1280946 RepID=A0A062UHZ7_9PROT|nr:hypothetical protein HY29_01050 [Hyphomonas beringensis]